MIKPYRVTVEVTTTYTVEVHANDVHDAWDRAWRLSVDEVEAQGSADKTETTAVADDPEEIQREGEEDES